MVHWSGMSPVVPDEQSSSSTPADAPVETNEAPGQEEDPPCDHDAYETVVTEEALDRWIAPRLQGARPLDPSQPMRRRGWRRGRRCDRLQ